MTHWSDEAVFYHIYPLGLCGAPSHNNFSSAPVPRLEVLCGWLDHISGMGFNALYLGPLFESSSHGYDTADYTNLDRRLGTNDTLAGLAGELHRRVIRLVLDGVFNHVGRDFWAFRDVRQNGPASPFCGWFSGLRFGGRSRHGDPFTYDNWNGHDSLVKLNLDHPEVRAHLFAAVESWVRRFGIAGLRLDAADVVDLGFQQELAGFCRGLDPDFWLMGEVIHGDYRRWANPACLDSVTNYEAYKGLYSSHNDRNYFEIAHSLDREFGKDGVYRGLPLYNFADNHDVTRVASLLKQPQHLEPLYTLLFCMPGIPSVYYGSEFGLPGVKAPFSDAPLRPAVDLGSLQQHPPRAGLAGLIQRLIQLRKAHPALRRGGYRQMFVGSEQLAFLRESGEDRLLVAVSAADRPVELELPLPGDSGGRLAGLLGPGVATITDGKARLNLPAWGRQVLQVETA